MECQSSVNLVAIEHHISLWLVEDSVAARLVWDNTGLRDQVQGVPTEDVAMLNASERRLAKRLAKRLKKEMT